MAHFENDPRLGFFSHPFFFYLLASLNSVFIARAAMKIHYSLLPEVRDWMCAGFHSRAPGGGAAET